MRKRIGVVLGLLFGVPAIVVGVSLAYSTSQGYLHGYRLVHQGAGLFLMVTLRWNAGCIVISAGMQS